MAPSLSPSFTIRALDVRGHPDTYDFINVLAASDPSPRAASLPSGGVSGAVIGLSILLVIFVGCAAAAAWYVLVQRKKLQALSTIRILYGVDAVANDTESSKSGITISSEQEKATMPSERMFSIDLSGSNRPRIEPVTRSSLHVLPSPGLRRKLTRMGARQRLRIVIPAGVSMPNVEVVRTATTPSTAHTVHTSGVSATRTSLVRRLTARTPRTPRTPRSALLSGITAVTSAASFTTFAVVQRREKVEPVYQSNGWAPATMVYLPNNPRDAANGPNTDHKVARKPVRSDPVPLITVDQQPAAVPVV